MNTIEETGDPERQKELNHASTVLYDALGKPHVMFVMVMFEPPKNEGDFKSYTHSQGCDICLFNSFLERYREVISEMGAFDNPVNLIPTSDN